MAVRHGEPISIPPKDVHYVGRQFSKAMALGEKRLHELSRMILDEIAPKSQIRTDFVVIGRCTNPEHEERFMSCTDFTKRLGELRTGNDSERTTDHRPACPRCTTAGTVVASYYQHIVKQNHDNLLDTLFARIKSTSNLSYKIADMVFDIDLMFKRDKVYNEFSQIVTDVYGIKAIITDDGRIKEFVDHLRKLHRVEVVEEKDYTGKKRKRSGFEAYKMVLRRARHLFEMQIQSRSMFENEQKSHTASHRTYREQQMSNRRRLGREYMEVYEAISRLLSPPDSKYCEIDHIELGFNRKGLDDEF